MQNKGHGLFFILHPFNNKNAFSEILSTQAEVKAQ